MSENPQVENISPEEAASPKKEVKENGHEDSEKTDPPKKDQETSEVKEEIKGDDDGDQKEDKNELEESKDEADDGKENEEDGEDEDEEDESSDEEPPQGSLDGPVKIMTGKRERKKVERLTMEQSEGSPDKKIEIKEGRGTKITEIPNIEYQISRTNAESLKTLHRIFFSRQGKILEIKKNIRKFCGFSFEREDAEFKKKESNVGRLTVAQLKEVCMLLDLERGGTRDQLVERVLTFCLEPKASGRSLAVKKKASKPKSKKKKKKVGPKGDAPKTPKSKKRSISEAEDDDDDDDEEEEEEEEDDSQEEEPPKKKKAKKETPKKPAKAKTPSKSKSPAKSPQKKKATPAKAKSKEVIDDSSDEDEPLVKKSKSMPSDSEIKAFIKDFLDGANLEEVTMKTVCKKVYENYPAFDLSHKKDYIKTTVKEIISS